MFLKKKWCRKEVTVDSNIELYKKLDKIHNEAKIVLKTILSR